MERNKILVVDDEQINRAVLTNVFNDDYDTLEAENGKEALELIDAFTDSIAIVLLDLIMPVMNGFEFVCAMYERHLLDRIPVILITSDDSEDAEVLSLDSGISDVMHKPVNPYIIRKRVDNLIELYQHKNHLEEMVEEQTKKLEDQEERIRATNDNVIETLSTIVEFRDAESGSHIRRIRKFTELLLRSVAWNYPQYGLTISKISMISRASLMHDIGKIAIPDNILLKRGKLTPEEFEIMKLHTVKGSEIMDKMAVFADKEFYQYCYDIIRHHHEKWDGKGYPDGLVGDDIPLAAQVVSVADIYDALVSERVYKSAYTHEEAIRMITGGECGAFSDQIMFCFREVADAFKYHAQQIN